MTGATLPAGTWDTHVHVFDPAAFPYSATRSYTPGPATLADLQQRHRQWGVSHAVLVQPSVYGTDNACLLDALTQLGPSARGVAVIDPAQAPDAALSALQAAGICGLRVNLVAGASADAADFLRTAARLRGSGMFLQVYAPLDTIIAHRPAFEAAGVAIVLDHFAGVQDADDAAAAEELEALVRNCEIWIKLSADYRVGQSAARAGSAALDLIARFWSLIPDRLIWGSDWPHTGGGATRRARPPGEIEPFRQVYALAVPQMMADAGLDEAARRRILARNPARLFRADATTPPAAGHEEQVTS